MPITGSQPALMVAQSGVMRAGASRSNYFTSKKAFISIAGVHYGDARLTSGNKVLVESLRITEVLHETPNTASLTTYGFEPVQGQDVIITLGSKNNVDRLFAGTVINRTHRYFEKPATWFVDVNVIDYTWHLTRRVISGVYTNQSATDIAKDIVSRVPGFTSFGVQAGLETLDVFSFTDVDVLSVLTRLAKRIGGYCDVDYYKDVHLFTSDASVTNPASLVATHPTLMDFQVNYDLSQVRTRVFVEGGGVTALAYCGPNESIIPVETIAWYNAAGGTIKSGSQHITYGGVFIGGGGTLVGPGAAPSSAPALSAGGTGSLGVGVYQYAYTDVTAAGESLPSPVASVSTGGGFADPTSFPNTALYDGGGATDEGFHDWAYTWLDSGGGETLPSPRVTRYSHVGLSSAFTHPLPLGPSGTAARRLYRTIASGSSPTGLTLKLVATINDNTTTTYRDGITDAALGAAAPGSNTTSTTAVQLSSIALGGSPTTSRKVYRTIVNGSQLKLLTTIANNTTTVYSDTTADGSLGANVPTSDTSGLTQPSGQVLAGASSLLIAGAGSASASGGWAIIGNGQQVIRYTGIASNTLTGIPIAGPGSITATVSYNSTVTFPPALTGIPSGGDGRIVYAILPGDEINIIVQVEDIPAQQALATLIGGTDDGVVEDFLQDRRLGETEARALATAQLELTSDPLITISYRSRDRNTHAGREVTVSLGAPTSVSGVFQIQHVTIDTFLPRSAPTYTVQASSSRFSLEDLLRLIKLPTRPLGQG